MNAQTNEERIAQLESDVRLLLTYVANAGHLGEDVKDADKLKESVEAHRKAADQIRERYSGNR